MTTVKDLELNKFKRDSTGEFERTDNDNSIVVTQEVGSEGLVEKELLKFKALGDTQEVQVSDFNNLLVLKEILYELRKMNFALSEMIGEEFDL